MSFTSRARIDKDEFIHAAPALIGQQVSIDHIDCPAGRDTRQRLYVKRTAKGVVAYCHNCGEYGVASNKGWREMKVIQDLVSNHTQQLKEAVAVSVPDDTVYNPLDFHHDALEWLYAAQIDDTLIQKHRIGYSPSWGRTILPVYDDSGNLIFWQGRAIGSIKPKYISVSGSQKPYKVIPNVCVNKPLTRSLIITEDMLSAIRLAQLGWHPYPDALPLLGTTIPSHDLLKAIEGYTYIIVWLDDDEAGRVKASRLIEQLKLLVKPKVSIYRCDTTQASKLLDVKDGLQKCIRV